MYTMVPRVSNSAEVGATLWVEDFFTRDFLYRTGALALISVGATAVPFKGCEISREGDLWGDLSLFFISLVGERGFFFFKVLASGVAAAAPPVTRAA